MVGISRILKAGGRLLFDPKFQDTVTDSIKASKKVSGYKNMHVQIKDAFIKANNATKNTTFWGSMKESLTSLGPDIKTNWKAASGITGKSKAVFKQLGKRMPLLGVLLTIGFEVPNIVSAFKDKGLVGGLVETGKSTARLAGATAGFAIGQALIPIPIVGGLIGAIAGDWLVSKVVGKSHSEKKAEAEAAAQQQNEYVQNNYDPSFYGQQQTGSGVTTSNYTQPTMTPQQLMAMQQMLYNGGFGNPMDQDFMAMTSGINRLNYLC